MASAEPLRILLVEDDEDDFVLTQSMLLAQGEMKLQIEWEQSYAPALRAVRSGRHDLYLIDYRLGERTGLDLVREAWGSDPPAPVIVLTGQDDHEVDVQATELGVTDFLVKGTIDAMSLERTIRYALRHHRAIVDLREAQKRLVHDALHDSLTGLPNRTLFMDRLVQCLSHLRRDPAHGCAVLYIDVDRFKLVNDSLSHAAGDRLLMELATRVGEILRPGDTLARLGGDEFTVLLDGIATPAQAMEVAARAGQAISEPIGFGGRRLSVIASIGIAHSLDGAERPEDLIRNADIAMYDAKAHGGGRCEIFDTSMHRRLVDRMSLESRLRQAIEQRRLRIFFQPIVDLRTGALHGLEALARWPAGGDEVLPSDFIPVAEEAGLIGPLGTLVLRGACRTLGDWRRSRLLKPDVTVSVNVSVRQITDGGLVDHVRSALAEAELPPANLVLEITESTLIENPELVSGVLGELMGLGVTVQLDDFGTGHSSLTVLHDFPGDTLKIDRAFVATMVDRPRSQAIIRSIVGLAHNLGLAVIAEGIEDSGQLHALTALGCQYGQGYHFARPLPTDEIEALLAQDRSAQLVA